MDGTNNGGESMNDGSTEGGDRFEGTLVQEPSENDVLCGRGGSINSHPGNERFRTLVEKRKRVYLTARFKREKRLIASSIVSEIRELKPPGRFLTKDSKSGKWKDIGDEKARDKTSQALRENAPTLRAEIEVEIKEKRAELRREDGVAANPPPSSHPPQAPPPHYYQGWGYQLYYGYGHPPPPPSHMPPPPGYGHSPYEGGHWGSAYPPPPNYGHASPPEVASSQPQQSAPSSERSVIEDFVASGTETIKSWIGTVHSVSSQDAHDNQSRSSLTQGSKPIEYMHEDGKKRRMVKFRDDCFAQRRRDGRSHYSQGMGDNSLADGDDEVDMEPEHIESNGGQVDHNSSLMTQFANNLIGSIGSWDASAIVCGNDNTDERIPFPGPTGSSSNYRRGSEEEVVPEEEMAVEWEQGQEVLLVEDQKRDASPERMPPPARVSRRPVAVQEHASVGFSSLGSCHSWLPEQISGAASFFSGGSQRGGGASGLSPSPSVDMDYSAPGTIENFSAAGSIGGSLGGNSLTRVFEHEPLDDSMGHPPPPAGGFHSPSMSNRILNQMPSWERSVRSRSPLSLGSDDEDISLISKTSSKDPISPGNMNGNEPAIGPDDMTWESRE